MKKFLYATGVQVIPVVLGIWIALFANEWRENAKNERFIKQVFTSISLELEENKVNLEKRLVEHQSIIDTIDIYMENDSMNIAEILSKANGFQGSNVKNTAWKSFINPNIELVEYQTISVLTDIEEDKQSLILMLGKFMDFIYSKFDSTLMKDKQLFALAIGDIIFVEEELLDSHKKFFKQMKVK